MKKSLKIIITLLLFFNCGELTAQQTERIYLSGIDAAYTKQWDFFCTAGRNSGRWTQIEVPSNWELQGFGTYNYGLDGKNKDIQLGKEHGLYKTSFPAPSAWKGKTIEIVFAGSMTDTKVTINGQIAGAIHQGAFNAFRYDVSRLLKYGKQNLLEVDVAKHSENISVNQAERQSDFWIFGGIFRPVYLEISPQRFMKRIAIDARGNGDFRAMVIMAGAKADGEISCEISAPNNTKVSEYFKTKFNKGDSIVVIENRFPGIKSWNPEDPNLYDVKFTLEENGRIIHEKNARIGFRTIELRVKDGFYLNGKKVVFKGVNRHSFWPETGRCLSEANHLQDISLMKEMNMNAVRMSHYQPDERFLELCDSLGLFVLDELTGWQQAYDTIVGPKLIRELILNDENHPCVVIWDHGNEGGWNFANEKWFHYYDVQKRPVIYPWLHRNGVDCMHYVPFNFGVNRFAYGTDVFMPMEFLHGLYDGGLGAGLSDYWNQFSANPRFAGGFLWAFCDEAVLRTDTDSLLYDSDGNHAPDGILGPHREKEGSFYTIRHVWSPVQPAPLVISKNWDGVIAVRNDFLFTNLDQCSFSWSSIKAATPGNSNNGLLASGKVRGPDALPGETRNLTIKVKSLEDADIFTLGVVDRNGNEICNWSWPVKQPFEIVSENLLTDTLQQVTEIELKEAGNLLNAIANEKMKFTFNLENGYLTEVENDRGIISFNGGPAPAGIESKVTDVTHSFDSEGNLSIVIAYEKYPHRIVWTLQKNGLLKLVAEPIRMDVKDVSFIGLNFRYPESKCSGIQWLGDGPYRVWKNRTQGVTFNVWEKKYNNTITGESFNNLVYPEFKGYHANTYWANFKTSEGNFAIYSGTSNLYMQLFKPGVPKHVTPGTNPPFPAGDISFLYEIPAIGTKFKDAEMLGPSSQKGNDAYHNGQGNDPIILWFDFRDTAIVQ